MQFLKDHRMALATCIPKSQRSGHCHRYYNDKDIKMKNSIGSSATLKLSILFLQKESWTWMEQEAENKFLMQTP